jgi:DNA polymerase-4
LAHDELAELSIAHLDCDAFYATVEKRDRPELAPLPVIVGGGARGVVLACCYVARLYGVRSAMPMFKALALCPDAVVIRPDMAKYREVGRAVRAQMQALTPLVEPLSIDEAFLVLTGSGAANGTLSGAAPAQLLAALALRIEAGYNHRLDRARYNRCRLHPTSTSPRRGDRPGRGAGLSGGQAGRLAVGRRRRDAATPCR